jgi:hypothetical protein
VQPDRIVAMPVEPAGVAQQGFDAALVHVPGVLPISSRRVSLAMNPQAVPDGQDLLAYGYGRFVDLADTNLEDGSSGAGFLRTAGGFRARSTCTGGGGCGRAGSFTYTDANASGQSVTHGDSGGPDFLQATTSDPFLQMIGIHSTGVSGGTGTDAYIPGVVPFIESNLGYLYVSSFQTPDSNLGLASGVVNGSKAITQTTKDALGTRWVYDQVTRNIFTKDASGARYFLTAGSTASAVSPRPVFVTPFAVSPSGYQTWSLSAGRIWSDQPGRTGSECLSEGTDHTVAVGACTGGATMTFAWHAQP